MNSLVILSSALHRKETSEMIAKISQLLAQEGSLDVIGFDLPSLERIQGSFKNMPAIQFRYYRDFLSNDDCDEVDDAAYDFARNWHKSFTDESGAAQFRYKGVPILPPMELEYAQFCVRLYLAVRAIRNAVLSEKPGCVYILGGDEVVKEAAQAVFPKGRFVSHGNLTDTAAIAFPPAPRREKAFVVATLIKDLRATSRRRKLRTATKGKALVAYQPHFSTRPLLSHTSMEDKISFVDLNTVNDYLWGRIRTAILKRSGLLRDWFLGVHKLRLEQLDRFLASKRFCSKATFDGVELSESIATYIKEMVRSAIVSLCYMVDASEEMFLAFSPRVTLTATYVTPRQRIMFEKARRHGARSVTLWHGLMSTMRRSSDIVYSDYLIVWGEQDQEYFELLHDCNKAKVVVCGNPNYDQFAANGGAPKGKRRTTLAKLNIPLNRKVVLYVSNYYVPWSAFDSADTIERGLMLFHQYMSEASEGIHAIVKLHPVEKPERAYEVFGTGGLDSRISIVQDFCFLDLVAASDVVVTFPFSTAGLDSIVCGKPFLLLGFAASPHEIPYVEYGTCKRVSSIGELNSEMTLLLRQRTSSPGRRESYAHFLRDFAFALDGRSTERILLFLHSLC